MPRGGEFSGASARGASFAGDALAFELNSDIEVTVPLNQNSDVHIDVAQPLRFKSDVRQYISNAVDFLSDIKQIISLPINFNSDIVIRVFNPEPVEFKSDIYLTVWPLGGLAFDENTDVVLHVAEGVAFDSDIEQETKEGVDFDSDLETEIKQAFKFFSDISLHVHTDPNDPTVVNIAIILDRRYLPYMPESVMHKTGEETNRYKFLIAVAAAEFQARAGIERMLDNQRLTLASGSSLDRVADRVAEKRWQFYDDRVDRFEGDSCLRSRLTPYFTSRRGTLDAIKEAVAPLHDCYGGHSIFYSYVVGDGWMLSVVGRDELNINSYLGGRLTGLDPTQRLLPTDLWMVGIAGHTELGLSTYLGDRERLGPFTFIVEVWDYPSPKGSYPSFDEWHKLYLHTVDRFRAAGTVPIVIFRRGQVMRSTSLTGDGTADYTIPGVNLEGKTLIVTVNGLSQTPATSYTWEDDGSNTILTFSEAPTAGDEIVVYYMEDE